MVEEPTTLNGGLHSRTVEGKIRRRIRKQCRHIFLLFSSVSSDGSLGLSRLVVAISKFDCASDYTIANNMYLLGIGFIRG
jgi:hypothetical protein